MSPSRNVNPFEASELPDALPVDPIEVEKVSAHRRRHLNVEIIIRSVGWTFLVLTALTIGSALLAFSKLAYPGNSDEAEETKTFLIVSSILCGVFGPLGVGLARLNNLARVLTGILAFGILLINVLVTVLAHLIRERKYHVTPLVITTIMVCLWLTATLHSRKASNICWPKYYRVIELTPHIKYNASVFLRVLLGIPAIVALNMLIAKVLAFTKVFP